MATFVIVHGAWGGGWEWSPVASILRAQGHRAFTPTLTGMGDRAHLWPGEPVGLGTHIDDIVAVLEFERLRDVGIPWRWAPPAHGTRGGSTGR